jgi:hypothetical protein
MILFAGCNNGSTGENNIPANNAETAVRSIFQPVEAPDQISRHLDHESVITYHYVEIVENDWNPGHLREGDVFSIRLEEGLVIDATVHRIQTPMDGITSIHARSATAPRADILLTMESSRLTGNITIHSEGRQFHIRYDRNAALHYLAEVDPRKLDTMEGSEPLIPDNNQP